MAKVTGIGGVFFRAKDPEGLAKWYATHLGVDNGESAWSQEAGYTVFAPFPDDTDYFPEASRSMLNFRVDDLAELIDSLEAAGIAVETRAEWDSLLGKFARVHDPEGNPIELWEPAFG